MLRVQIQKFCPKKGTGQFSKAVVLLSRHILEILIYYRAKLSKGAQNKRIPVQLSHRHESTTKAPPPTVQRTSPPRHGLLQLNSTVCLRNLENPHSLSVNSGFVLRPLSVFLAPGESLFFSTVCSLMSGIIALAQPAIDPLAQPAIVQNNDPSLRLRFSLRPPGFATTSRPGAIFGFFLRPFFFVVMSS